MNSVLMGMIKQNNNAINKANTVIIKDFQVIGNDISSKEVVHALGNRVLNDDLLVSGSPFDLGEIAQYPRIAKLTDTKVIVVYTRTGNNPGVAVIADISGDVITFGSKYIFHVGVTEQLSVVALTDTKAIIQFEDANARGIVMVASISGTTITFGSEHVFHNNRVNSMHIAKLTNTKAIIVFRDHTNVPGIAKIANISGTVITFGSNYQFNVNNSTFLRVGRLTDTKAVITFKDDAVDDRTKAVIANISGMVITFSNMFDVSNLQYGLVVPLTESKIAVVLKASNSYKGVAVVGDISDNTITFGSAVMYATRYVYGINAFKLNSYNEHTIVIPYLGGESTASLYETAVITRIAGDAMTCDPPLTLESASSTSWSFASCGLTEEKVISVRYDTTTGKTYGKIRELYRNTKEDIGIAMEDGAEGSLIKVLLSGHVDGFTDIHCGQAFIGKERTVGYGLSDSSIVVKPFWEV